MTAATPPSSFREARRAYLRFIRPWRTSESAAERALIDNEHIKRHRRIVCALLRHRGMSSVFSALEIERGAQYAIWYWNEWHYRYVNLFADTNANRDLAAAAREAKQAKARVTDAANIVRTLARTEGYAIVETMDLTKSERAFLLRMADAIEKFPHLVFGENIYDRIFNAPMVDPDKIGKQGDHHAQLIRHVADLVPTSVQRRYSLIASIIAVTSNYKPTRQHVASTLKKGRT